MVRKGEALKKLLLLTGEENDDPSAKMEGERKDQLAGP